MKPNANTRRRRRFTLRSWSSATDLRRVYPGGAMRVIDGAAFMPMGNTDTRPIVVEFPGASLMSIEVLAAEQFIVRCPGCRASQLFALPRNGSTLPAFLHTSVECPIHRRIETLTRA